MKKEKYEKIQTFVKELEEKIKLLKALNIFSDAFDEYIPDREERNYYFKDLILENNIKIQYLPYLKSFKVVLSISSKRRHHYFKYISSDIQEILNMLELDLMSFDKYIKGH